MGDTSGSFQRGGSYDMLIWELRSIQGDLEIPFFSCLLPLLSLSPPPPPHATCFPQTPFFGRSEQVLSYRKASRRGPSFGEGSLPTGKRTFLRNGEPKGQMLEAL